MLYRKRRLLLSVNYTVSIFIYLLVYLQLGYTLYLNSRREDAFLSVNNPLSIAIYFCIYLQLGYTLYWNSSQVHSIPVGINALSNVMYHVMNSIAFPTTSTNVSTLPIVTYNKPFKPRQPQWVYDYAGQIAILFIGLSVATMAGGFSIEVVHTREVKYS